MSGDAYAHAPSPLVGEGWGGGEPPTPAVMPPGQIRTPAGGIPPTPSPSPQGGGGRVPLFANGLRGGHVLAAFLAFFGVIFAVNGVFLYMALSTHTGLVAQEPYRKGLHYNDRIAAAERQQALGWTSDLRLAPESGALTLALT